MDTRRYLLGVVLLLAVIGCRPAPDQSFQNGIAHFQAREYSKAAAALEKAIAAAPPTPQALTLIGVCRLHTGNAQAAMLRFRQALQLDGNYLPARYNLALAQLQAGQTEAAAQSLQQLAQLKGVPADLNQFLATAYNNLAVAAARQRDTERATQFFELAIKADPGSVAVRNLAALRTPAPAPKPPPPVAAATILRPAAPPPATNATPQPAPPPARVSAPLLTNPAPAAAAQPPTMPVGPTTTVAVAPRPQPGPGSTQNPAGVKRRSPVAPRTLASGQREEARKYFAEAVKLQQQGKLPNAIAYYLEALKHDANYPQAYYNLAIAYRDTRQFDRALDNYELALVADPKFHDARWNYAILLQNQGYIFDAAEQYQTILQANPNDPVVHLALAALYAHDRVLRPQARQHYETYLRLAPNSPQAREIRRWLEQNR